jgi:WD domain, G-beta repeat
VIPVVPWYPVILVVPWYPVILVEMVPSEAGGDSLAFAIKEHADNVLGRLTQARQVIALRILLRLVNFGEGRDDTRRQQPREAVRSDSDVAVDFDTVFQHLVDNRLLTVTGDDQHKDVRVDLAHEILIHGWPIFADWIKTSRADEQRRRVLEAAAADWRKRGGGDGGLLDPIELASAIAWRDKAAKQLGHTAHLTAYLAASKSAQSQATRRNRLTYSAVFLVIAALALLVRVSANLAAQQRRNAERQRKERVGLLLEGGRQQLLNKERPLQALPYLVTAREATEEGGDPLSSPLRLLFAEATRNLPLGPPIQHQGIVTCATFSPDGKRIVTASADKAAYIWDDAIGTPRSLRFAHQDRVESVAFSPDGKRIVTASWDKTARVWDAITSKPLSPPLEHYGRVMSAIFSPDGTRIATSSWDGTACIWDAITGERLVSLKH